MVQITFAKPAATNGENINLPRLLTILFSASLLAAPTIRPAHTQQADSSIPLPVQKPARSPYEPRDVPAPSPPRERFKYVPSGDVLVINKQPTVRTTPSSASPNNPVPSAKTVKQPAATPDLSSLPIRPRRTSTNTPLIRPSGLTASNEQWLSQQAQLKAEGQTSVRLRRHKLSPGVGARRIVRRRTRTRARARRRVGYWPRWAYAAMQPES